MDVKQSTVSESAGNSESDSPPPAVTSAVVPVPRVMTTNVAAAESVAMERSNNISARTTATIGSGGDGGSGGGIGGGQGSGSADLFGNKKRGRPRKYDAHGNLRVKLKPSPFQFQQAIGCGEIATQSPPHAFSFSPSEHFLSFSSSSSSSRRGRGRPPGSGNWPLLASLGAVFANTAGGDFTPHVVTVNTGEDVAGKIVSLSQNGPRGICILSANGTVSNVTIRQPGSSGGILTYEGRFEILSLCGSFTLTETGGVRSRTGGLSVSLAGPDGRVIGGGVAGLLLAASPIQIVVGSFMPNGYKIHKRKHYREHAIASMVSGAPDMATEGTSTSEAKPEDQKYVTPPASLVDSEAPPACLAKSGESQGRADNSEIQVSNSSASWNGTDHASNQKLSRDINVSVSSEE